MFVIIAFSHKKIWRQEQLVCTAILIQHKNTKKGWTKQKKAC